MAETFNHLIGQDEYEIFVKYTGEYFLSTYKGTKKELVLPNDINGKRYDIYWKAFYENERLERVIIPEGVKSVGGFAFYACTKLREVTLPKTLEQIEWYAFMWSVKLERIYYGGTIAEWKEVGKGAWWDKHADDYTVVCTDGTVNKEIDL